MNKARVYLIRLGILLCLLLAACSGTTPTPQTEEPKSVESVVTEEPKPTKSVFTEEPKTTIGPRTGDIAPGFTLPDSNGNMVHLADELNDNRMVILIFYHAYT